MSKKISIEEKILEKNFAKLNVNLISALRKKVNELQRSEEKFKVIFDNSVDGIIIVDINTKKFIMANTTIQKMLGYSSDELLRMKVQDIHPKKDLPHILKQFEMQKKGVIWIAEDIPIKRKDRSIFYSDIGSSPVTLDGKNCLIGTFRDVTEKRMTERKLQENEAKFRALAEHSQDAIMRFDKKHRHTYANKIVKKMTGIPTERFIGKTHQELGFPKDLCKIWEKAIDKVFHTGKTNHIEFQLPNGIWIDWVLSPELDQKNKVMYVITLARDVTEKKKLVESLRWYKKQMAAKDRKSKP